MDKNNLIDDNDELIVDDEDVARVAKMLKASKKDRKKMLNDKKFVPNDKNEEIEKENVKNSEDTKDFKSLPFSKKMKKDKVIPITIVTAIILSIAVLLWFILPTVIVSAMPYTIEEFRTKYSKTELYTSALSSFGFGFPEVSYVDEDTTSASDSTTTSKKSSMLNYFNGTIINTAFSNGVGVQGSTRKIDGKITALRIIIEASGDSDFYNAVVILFASYIQAFIPNMTSQEAITASQDAISTLGNDSNSYTINGDIAYMVSIINQGNGYIALDFISADNIPDTTQTSVQSTAQAN